MKSTLLKRKGVAMAVLGASFMLASCGGGGGASSSGVPTASGGSSGNSPGSPTTSNYTQSGIAIDGPINGTVYVYDLNSGSSLVSQASVVNGQFQITLPNTSDTYLACVTGQDGSYTISTSSPFNTSIPTYLCGIFNTSLTSEWFINPLTNYITYLTFSNSSASSSNLIQSFINSLSQLGIQYKDTISNFQSATNYMQSLSQVFGSNTTPFSWFLSINTNPTISIIFPNGPTVPAISSSLGTYTLLYTSSSTILPNIPSTTIPVNSSQFVLISTTAQIPPVIPMPVAITPYPNYYYDEVGDIFYCPPSSTVCSAIAIGISPDVVLVSTPSSTVYMYPGVFQALNAFYNVVNNGVVSLQTLPMGYGLYNCNIPQFLATGDMTCELGMREPDEAVYYSFTLEYNSYTNGISLSTN